MDEINEEITDILADLKKIRAIQRIQAQPFYGDYGKLVFMVDPVIPANQESIEFSVLNDPDSWYCLEHMTPEETVH